MSDTGAILLVDLGNTRIKWVWHGVAEWRPQAAPVTGRILSHVLEEIWSDASRPHAVVAVSVADTTTSGELLAWVRRRWSIVPHRVTAKSEFLGVRNGYREPSTLGADRWAALIGARGETDSSVCVVDCGTAVTIDALNADGAFLGGVIFPGVTLLRDALTRGTAGVQASDGEEVSSLARSTADGVAAGSVYGLAGAIERVAREFEQTLEEPMALYLTGGDAQRINAYLTRPGREVADLVLKGLARIADTL